MKLSDIRGARTLDVVAEIIEPIANIAECEEAKELFKREKLPEGTDAKRFLLERAKRCVPTLLKEHKKDLIAILAAINGVCPEAYTDSLNLAKLFADCVDLITDEAFMAFFTQNGKSSGNTLETTEVPEA